MLRDETLRSIGWRLVGLKKMEQICAAWDLTGEVTLGESVLHAQFVITSRMKSPIAARFVWQRLERTAQRFFYELLCAKNLGKGVPCTRIQKQLKLADEEVETIVLQLKAMYLLEEDTLPGQLSAQSREHRRSAPVPVRALFLYEECAQSLWDTGQELFLAYGNREKQPLFQLLRLMRWNQLEHLARLCHVTERSVVPFYTYTTMPSASYPQDIHLGITDALQHPPIFFKVFHTLELYVQDFFLWLCKRGGKVAMAEAQAYLAAQGCTGRSLYLLFETLENHALAFDTLQLGGERVVFVHQDILSTLKEDIEQYALYEQQHALLPLPVEPVVVEEGLPRILYDVATCVGWVHQYALEETREGKLPKRVQNKIRPLLHGRPRIRENDDVYLEQLFSTVKALKLLHCILQEDEKRRYHPTAFLAQWEQMTIGEQMRRFLAWWGKSTIWCDVQPGGAMILTPDSNIVEARKALLAHLSICSPGEWYHISSLLFSIWKHSPLHVHDFSRKQYRAERLSLREHQAQWLEKGEGQTYLALLRTTLYEAGIISVGYNQADPQSGEPDMFRLTELGAAALSEPFAQSGTPFLSGEQQRIIVQPNYEIVLLGFESNLIYRLTQFTLIQTMNQVSRFTLTRTALLRGLEAGNQLEDILSFLTEASQRSLPQNVTYSLHDWAKGHKEARVSSVLLIELLPDTCEADLSRSLADVGVEVRRLAPGLFALPADALPFAALCKRLEKEGLVVRGQPLHA